MRNFLISTMTLLLLVATTVQADDDDRTARLQIIHNAADPAAETVDIYVNGTLFEDDFSFRSATEFRSVPAEVPLNVGIAPGNSSSAADAIATIPVELEENETYVAFANGVLDPGSFDPNPDGRLIGFKLFANDDIREESRWRWFTDLIVFHGATDAPTVDIVAPGRWSRPLAQDLSYGEFSEYRTVFPRMLPIDVQVGGDVFASFKADLRDLRGAAAVVFASGFVNESQGAPFGLFAAFPNGTVAKIPRDVETTELQVIHNAADPAAAVVDIYVNGALYEDDFTFRQATESREVPAGVELNIGVAPGNSGSVNDTIVSFQLTLEPEKKYLAFANGVLNPGDFDRNPEGEKTAFTLFATDDAATESGVRYLTKLRVFHGATDAPAVDIFARGKFLTRRLFDDVSYGQFTACKPLLATSYTLYVTPADDRGTVVGAFEADLRGLRGGAGVVFASGFLNDSQGPAFGLFAVLPDGTVIELPAQPLPDARASKVLADDGNLPNSYTLEQNYPNPFNPTTTISFALPKAGAVNLTVYNLLGQRVEILVDRQMEAGEHQVEWDAGTYASGVYFYRLSTNSFSSTRRMVLVK